MEYTIEPGIWTYVGRTGVQVRWDGEGSATVTLDDMGAVLLPALTAQEADMPLWSVIPGLAPVTRIDEPFSTDPAFWPGGFQLVEGRWALV